VDILWLNKFEYPYLYEITAEIDADGKWTAYFEDHDVEGMNEICTVINEMDS